MKALLARQQRLLQKQKEWLNFSYNQCKEIGIKPDYTIEEFGYFETLCSRYSRSIDFLIRKYLRTLDTYELENQGTIIDIINRAHKRGLTDDIETIRIMKDLRNSIVHEYIEEDLIPLFDDLLLYTPKLLQMMQKSLDYTRRYLDEDIV